MFSITRLRVLAAIGCGLMGVLLAIPASAQVAGGTISGTVKDPSGAVVPGASITITNEATGVSRNVAANTDGLYTAPNLLPGTYELKCTATGFRTEVRRGVLLTVGATQVLDVTMQVGTTGETVVVTSEVPAVQLGTSDISAVVNATTVRELPLNGRSWTDLATLQPGVDRVPTQPSFASGTDRGNRGFGQQLTISGARPQQNNYRLDGISLNDYANGAPGSVLGGSLGVDAIQEFSVLTTNYSADYGKTSGGVVNAITRSGTNRFHGSAYEFLRNSALDARNFFDGSTIPPFKRNQFGGAIGGPIVKDRTFFFADYEGIRQSKGITALTTVPSPAARNGILCSIPGGDPSNPCTTNPITVDPAAKAYLPFWHLPNGPILGNGDVGVFTFAGQQVVTENYFTTRVDHKLSNKDSLFGTYVYDKTPYSSPDGLDNVEFNTTTARQIAALEETHSFRSSLVNSIRIGGNHEAVNNNDSSTPINPLSSDKSLGSFAGRAASQVIMDGVTPFTGGVGGSPTYFYHWNSIQAYDDAFLTKGKHSINFGVSLERMLLNVIADTDPNGIWRFGNLQDFLTNNPSKFQGGLAKTLSPRNLRQTLLGLYLQDDWRWRPNLTLNLGLRYEMSTVPTETSGKLANLRVLTDPAPHLGEPFFSNPTLRDFEPRLGFAWDPRSNGKTAVRGGFGVFDVQPLPYQMVLLTTQAFPFFQYTNLGDVTPGEFFSHLPAVLPGNKVQETYLEPHPKRNYVMQWNLNIQQQLTPSLAGMIAYVGSRGLHQPFRVDNFDQIMPVKTPFGYLWPQVDANGNLVGGPNAGQAAVPFNQNFGAIRGILYQGHSYYNALEMQLAKRMSHGFQVQGTYTWSKSIDTGSASVAGDTFGNSISSLPFFDMKLNRGLSDFNVGRTLVVNGTWIVPSPKALKGPAGWALGGWELGLIFTASDGVPFTATFGTGSDPLNSLSSDDWDVPNRLGGSGCQTLTNPGNPTNYIKTQCFAVPTAPNLAFWQANCDKAPPSNGGVPVAFPLCFNLRGNSGRNVLIGPGVTETDFSIFKNNYIRSISENFNVQFRAEFFNILNHPNFAPPITPDNTDIFDGTGTATGVAGLLTSTTTTAREIQFAIKVIF
jgi:carboxypeptidase family protein/TonB-dependent receptor-like protein